MAAAQKTGRLCQCGCGASIDHMATSALYTPECKHRIHNERKRLCNIKRLARLKASRLNPAKCKVCWGLPWARGPHRCQNDVTERKVGDATWHCVGCGEPYEPEPPVEPGPLLRSSMGTTRKAGELWGYQPAQGGQKTGEQLVAVRAAKEAKGKSDGQV